MHLVVVHPRAGRRSRREYGEALGRALGNGGAETELLETAAGPDNAARLAERLARGDVRTLAAAGGDGTVRDAVEALLTVEDSRRPALVVVPLGTANNVAQALAQFPRRAGGAPPSPEEVTALLLRGRPARIDAAFANGRAFAGAFAAGMDADILAWRDRRTSGLPAALAGYPLYLAACAVNATREHGSVVDVEVEDGEGRTRLARGHGFNVLATNTAVYAGEFRFAPAGPRHDDGLLDLLWSHRRGDYLRCYASAWPRHLRARAGASPAPEPRLQQARRVQLRFNEPVDWQLDGESMGAASRFDLRVEAGALPVLRP